MDGLNEQTQLFDGSNLCMSLGSTVPLGFDHDLRHRNAGNCKGNYPQNGQNVQLVSSFSVKTQQKMNASGDTNILGVVSDDP